MKGIHFHSSALLHLESKGVAAWAHLPRRSWKGPTSLGEAGNFVQVPSCGFKVPSCRPRLSTREVKCLRAGKPRNTRAARDGSSIGCTGSSPAHQPALCPWKVMKSGFHGACHSRRAPWATGSNPSKSVRFRKNFDSRNHRVFRPRNCAKTRQLYEQTCGLFV